MDAHARHANMWMLGQANKELSGRGREVKGEEGLHTDHSHVRWHAGLRTERPGIKGLPHFKLFTKNVTREEQDVGDEAYLVHGSG